MAIDAFTQACKEENSDNLPLEFSKVQKALRLMGKAISETIFKAWCEQMEG